MGKQKSHLKVQGTIDDITYYQRNGQHLMRKKGGIDPKKIATDPRFLITRQNGAEFSRAGGYTKLLREAFKKVIHKRTDTLATSRLSKAMMDVVKSDPLNGRGLRNAVDGNPELLLGFSFNQNADLSAIFPVPFETVIDKATGQHSISIPAFTPLEEISYPPGATQFKIVSAAAALDFERGVFVNSYQSTGDMELDDNITQPISLVNSVPAASPGTVFIVMGIVFSQGVNAILTPMGNTAFNALSIVAVSK